MMVGNTGMGPDKSVAKILDTILFGKFRGKYLHI